MPFISLDFLQDADPEDHYEFFSQNNYPKCNYHTVSEFNSYFNKNHLSLVNCNIRSFNRNFDTLNSVFHGNNLPSIFCLTETKFSSSTVQKISGYDPFHTPRDSDTAAGGISLYIKKNLRATKIDALSYCNDTIEISTAEFNFGKQHAIVIGVYRPHSDTIENFN